MLQINGSDLIDDLQSRSKKYMCLADVLMFLSLKLKCEMSVAAEILLSRIPLEQGSNPIYFGKKIGMARFRQSPNDPLLSGLLEGVIIGEGDDFNDNPFNEPSLSRKYWEYSFDVEGLEQAISFKLDTLSSVLPDYLKPYEIRIGIQLKEVANILAGCKPRATAKSGEVVDIINGYQDALWEAYDHGVLKGTNVITDYYCNEEYRTDITLVKDEVADWAIQHGLEWPFKKSVEAMSENKDLIIDSLKKKNEMLQRELISAKAMIPQMLKQYREDDPLAIAIAMRNDEWLAFNEDDPRATTPSVEYLVAKLKTEFGMSGALAAAIEKVACPILRRGS